MKIGLCLSGGGIRAVVFHLGVLARLAEDSLLEQVEAVSSVSGGSLCAGLVFRANEYRWPDSGAFKGHVIPHIRRIVTEQGLQASLIARVLRMPGSLLKPRAADVSRLIQERWDIDAKLEKLPARPAWYINATCYETGKNWRFNRETMGDFLYGKASAADMPISDAMAASAAFPVLIGPLLLDTSQRTWTDSQPVAHGRSTTHAQRHQQVHLWDGGVYDNFGMEALFKIGQDKPYREGVDFLVVSDATGHLRSADFRRSIPLKRLIDIAEDQIESVRSRAVIEEFRRHQHPGVYFQIGNTCSHVMSAAGQADRIPALCPGYLPDQPVHEAADFDTTLRNLTIEEFETLFRHGFEVADYTLAAYHPDQFSALGYGSRT